MSMKSPAGGSMTRKKTDSSDEVVELLKKMLIAQLGLAGVSQKDTRSILGCDMHAVQKIQKHLKSQKKTV
jgi:hypothetical protein